MVVRCVGRLDHDEPGRHSLWRPSTTEAANFLLADLTTLAPIDTAGERSRPWTGNRGCAISDDGTVIARSYMVGD